MTIIEIDHLTLFAADDPSARFRDDVRGFHIADEATFGTGRHGARVGDVAEQRFTGRSDPEGLRLELVAGLVLAARPERRERHAAAVAIPPRP
jgi:hypothetical protein